MLLGICVSECHTFLPTALASTTPLPSSAENPFQVLSHAVALVPRSPARLSETQRQQTLGILHPLSLNCTVRATTVSVLEGNYSPVKLLGHTMCTWDSITISLLSHGHCHRQLVHSLSCTHAWHGETCQQP